MSAGCHQVRWNTVCSKCSSKHELCGATLPTRSVSGQPMHPTFLALWLLHGPSAIQVKDYNSCLLLLTVHFKIPLFLFFHKLSSWFSSVKWLTMLSPLVSTICLFPPGSPSMKRQEDLLPRHAGQEAPTLTSVVHELSQVKMHLVWQSGFTERKRRRTITEGNDQFGDSTGLILFLVCVFSWGSEKEKAERPSFSLLSM